MIARHVRPGPECFIWIDFPNPLGWGASYENCGNTWQALKSYLPSHLAHTLFNKLPFLTTAIHAIPKQVLGRQKRGTGEENDLFNTMIAKTILGMKVNALLNSRTGQGKNSFYLFNFNRPNLKFVIKNRQLWSQARVSKKQLAFYCRRYMLPCKYGKLTGDHKIKVLKKVHLRMTIFSAAFLL